MTHRVAVIPFGFGLGDTVNMRPLLLAVARSRPASRITVVCPDEYRSLLPEGVESLCSIHGLPLWQRPNRAAIIARVFHKVSARSAAPVVRGLTAGNWPRALSALLYRQGFDEVLNLLEPFRWLCLDDRWTPGPWSSPSGHLIDCMATLLRSNGIDLYVGLFGSTDPHFLGPYDADVRDIVLSQAPHEPVCRGCWTAQLLPRAACALGYDPGCLSRLQVGDVLPRIRRKLAARSAEFHTREGMGVDRAGTTEPV